MLPAAPKRGRGRRRLRPAATVALAAVSALLVTANPALAQSLRPSRASLEKQNREAQRHDFTYLRDRAHLMHFVQRGWLVRLRGNADYALRGVSFPYARPEVKLFVERLSRQYRGACGEALVVTSLTRPSSNQPRNASRRSVHPTGMALDLRRSHRRSCREWLERTLLVLEGRGLLEASRERWPAHYHVALFPAPYARYVERRTAASYRVTRGDSLWSIARRHDTSVTRLRQLNDLRSDVIRPGQVLRVPRS